MASSVTRFVPTENLLFEYYQRVLKLPFKLYQTWLYNQRRELVEFAIDFGFDLIMLAEKSKAPPPTYNSEPLTLEQALQHIHNGGNLGVRGNKQLVLLDYDSKELTPELEWLASKTLTIMTPNGWTFITLEPVVDELWLEMEKRFAGFSPSEATVKARLEAEVEESEMPEWVGNLPVEEQEALGWKNRKRFMLGNARRNRSYVVYPGSITCSFQTKATGIPKPKGVQHFGFGHSDPNQLCNGNGNQAHEYRYRFFYKPDGDYSSFTPTTATILPFDYFAKVALGKIVIGKKKEKTINA